VVGILICGVVLSAGGALATGSAVWNRATTRAMVRLRARDARRDAPRERVTRFTHDQLSGLPTPVARYFEFALKSGQPLIAHARLTQSGVFARQRDAWASFTAVEEFHVWPPGFVWDARIRVAPLLAVRVRDSYLDGTGAMQAKLAALVTVVNEGGTPEMATGSLLRYLAEAVWLPTALLPSAGVRWEEVDDSTARATLTATGRTATMDVHFGPRGEIQRISARRHRDVHGTPVLTHWEGRFWDYAHVNGMIVPRQSEVGWVLPEGWFPYWRGSTTSSEFDWIARD
jgi:hypothetical protein